MGTTAITGIAQLLLHPGTLSHAIVLGMQLTHALHQSGVLLSLGTRRVRRPTAIPTGRNPYTSTHPSRWETRRGIIGSSDASRRRSRAELCRLCLYSAEHFRRVPMTPLWPIVDLK